MKIKPVLSLGVTAFFVALAVWHSMLQDFTMLLLSTFLGWNSYLYSHYLVTGECVHTRNENIEITLPHSIHREILAVAGTAAMILSLPVGIIGVNQMNFLILLSSTLLFVYGFAILHEGMTGSLL
ncbi:MAG: hypothetical protein ABEJ56_04100 [Candidatus Nanohaloarchaea archaeon]